MKLKNFLKIGILSLLLSLVSCGSSPSEKEIPVFTNGDSTETVSIYLELGEGGLYKGEEGGSNEALYVNNCIEWVAAPGSELPGKDDVTNVSGVKFTGWAYVPGHGHAQLMTEVPNYHGVVLYATFGKAPSKPIGDYQWFIVGEGSFVVGPDWNASGGIGMEQNENPEYSDQEFMALNVYFEAGDIWKIMNPHTNQWIETGWEANGYGSAIDTGDMESISSGYENSYNIKVKTAGYYDIYLKLYNNNDPTVWIQKSAA